MLISLSCNSGRKRTCLILHRVSEASLWIYYPSPQICKLCAEQELHITEVGDTLG